jgi:deoxyribodipyrimidine photo-lyase
MLVYWHKRDLRLLDNPALALSLDLCRLNNLEFLPIIGMETDLILNPETAYEFGNFWQFGFVSAMIPLVQNYEYFGIKAGIFNEPILDYFQKLHLSNPITILVSHQEHGTDGTFKRDKLISKFCKTNNITWHQLPPSGVIRGLKNRDKRDQIVKKYINSQIINMPDFGGIIQPQIKYNIELIEQFTELKKTIGKNLELRETSEKSALECLKSFTSSMASGYRGGISSPNSAFEFGSRLSQFLAFGSISIRYIHHIFWVEIKNTQNKKIKSGMLGAMQRLFWREHFVQRLESDSLMPIRAIHPDYNNIEYSGKNFEAYKTGKTGEPLIDACIRCLHKTGFINFRMRAMLVSYGVFGMDINWRELGKYLATLFLDYEPGIHWSQMQMQGGVTGINTIRVYSPQKQLLDQDPECIFVKKWIPELEHLEKDQILNYTKISLYESTNGKYPDPIMDFKTQSKINKSKTFQVRSKTTKESSQKVFIKHGSRKVKPKAKPKAKVKKLLNANTDQTLSLF